MKPLAIYETTPVDAEILANAHASAWPPDGLQDLASEWHKSDAREFVGRWGELGEEERFSVLQQAASLLRTGAAKSVRPHRQARRP